MRITNASFDFHDRKKAVIYILVGVAAVAILVFGIAFGRAKPNTNVTLELTTDKVLLNCGDTFDASKYLKGAYDSDGNDVSGTLETPEVSTEKPGSYEITYNYVSKGKTVATKDLKLIVAKKSASATADPSKKEGD